MWNSSRSSQPARSSAHRCLLVVLLLGACSVDKSFYSDRLYPCDVASSDDNACGPDYGCYGGARQLGSIDFCAPSCTGNSNDLACSPDGLALKRCSPIQSGTCPQEMSCIRTNVFSQEGVCLPMRSCSQRTDCLDPVRSECFSAVFENLKMARSDAQIEQMHCIQSGCAAGGEACNPATTCLQTALAPLATEIKTLLTGYESTIEGKENISAAIDEAIRSFGDFCTPNCDAKGNCPPSFVCSNRIFPFWQSKARFCLPGGNTTICSSDRDCMVGKCLLDRNVCAAPCATDDDCTPFNAGDISFTCVAGACQSGTRGTCNLLHGCPMGQSCVFEECVGGILGVPCIENTECAALLGLTCLEIPDREYKQCTKRCTDDGQCPEIGIFKSHCFKPRTSTTAATSGFCIPGERP